MSDSYKLKPLKLMKHIPVKYDTTDKDKYIAIINKAIDKMYDTKPYNYIVTSCRSTMTKFKREYFFKNYMKIISETDNEINTTCDTLEYDTPIGNIKFARGKFNISTKLEHAEKALYELFPDVTESEIDYDLTKVRRQYMIETSKLSANLALTTLKISDDLEKEFRDIFKDIKIKNGEECIAILRLFKIHRCLDGHKEYINNYNILKKAFIKLSNYRENGEIKGCGIMDYAYREVEMHNIPYTVNISKSKKIFDYIEMRTDGRFKKGLYVNSSLEDDININEVDSTDYITKMKLLIRSYTQKEYNRYGMLYFVDTNEYSFDSDYDPMHE